MSLRMNLYGWHQESFTQVLGSQDSAVLHAAAARLAKSLPREPELSKAKAWLHTLIEGGYTLAQDREPHSVPADGGLLTLLMETDLHVSVVYCIVRAIASDDHLDLANESSQWKHPAIVSLYQDVAACGFTRSKGCHINYFSWMSRLSDGSPMFGHDFSTEWSFYSILSNQELAAMIPVLQAAIDFTRPVPEGYPPDFAQKFVTSLSEGGKEFAADLIKWFGQLERAGQDAFILWS